MRSIKVQYLELAKEINNSIVGIALDYPRYENSRKCFLYELCYFENIELKIKQREEEILQYDILTGDLTPFFLSLDDQDYKDLEEYLYNDTEYENAKWNDEVNLINAILTVYRNDPKSWSVGE